MSVTIVDATGKRFTVRQPFSVMPQSSALTLVAGDVVLVRIESENEAIASDDDDDIDDDDNANDDEAYAIVLSPPADDKVKIAWIYRSDELPSSRQFKVYDFYMTDHVDTVHQSTILGTKQLPKSTAPTVLTNPTNRSKCKMTDLTVDTCAACIVSADWVASYGIDNVFTHGPGHAAHYRDEWLEFDAEKKAAALHLARSIYNAEPLNFANLAMHVQWFETL